MSNIRVNVYDGEAWAEPILWYAKGVQAMQIRPLADATSWRFWAAMHGFDEALWQALGHLTLHDDRPSRQITNQFWKQCQHGSWFFLPWHRGYLLGFETIVRAAVIDLGGPSDWALPYWNYFAEGQAKLPPAFASHTWPGEGPNPLFVPERYGPNNDGHVFVPVAQVNLKAMRDQNFTGVSNGGSPGFGGIDTGFSHGGPTHGGLESQPHDMVHVFVGGTSPGNARLPGLMTDPDTAALDPIFWLHHANIDRLWASWNDSAGHQNPTNSKWNQGPSSVGQRSFVVPTPTHNTWKFAPHELVSLTALGYSYDTLDPRGRAEAVITPPSAPVSPHITSPRETLVQDAPPPELIGATTEPVSLDQTEVTGQLQLDPTARRSLIAAQTRSTPAATKDGDSSQSPTADVEQAPVAPSGDGAEHQSSGSNDQGRVLLNLENVSGDSDGTAFHVYVGLHNHESAEAHPELLAGTVAPFGMRRASRADDEHGGQGLNFVLDITDVVNTLHLSGSFDVDRLPVRLVPVGAIAPGGQLRVGRVSIYRQAA